MVDNAYKCLKTKNSIKGTVNYLKKRFFVIVIPLVILFLLVLIDHPELSFANEKSRYSLTEAIVEDHTFTIKNELPLFNFARS